MYRVTLKNRSKWKRPFLFVIFGSIIVTALAFANNFAKYRNIEIGPNSSNRRHLQINNNRKSNDTLLARYCFDKSNHFEIGQRGKYWVFVNFIKAETSFKCHESITLTTNADFKFLDNLIAAIEKWRGPISVALYAPGDDFHTTLTSIAYLRTCESALIRKYVTFHVFFDLDHVPKLIKGTPLIEAYKDVADCSNDPPYKTIRQEDTYRKKRKLMFPINVARNIAIEPVQTHFILPLDIELYPSGNFITNFLKLINGNGHLIEVKNVFVLPHFEVTSDSTVPDTKKELQTLVKKKSALPFHQQICAKCHTVPKIDEWLEAVDETDALGIFTVIKRHAPYEVWEPFFVSTIHEPLFDERFFWEGENDKFPQGYALCLMDYNFVVLDNAFLVHKPGIKQARKRNYAFEKFLNASYSLKFTVVQPELEVLYGQRRQYEM